MKFPESWLREHVTVSATRDELSARLTAIGLEVEDAQVLGEGLDGVIVAEIVSCARHPEADRLQVCQVAIGGGQSVQIVCGAPNARPGLKAPLAMVGATLPGGMVIGAAKLRGVDSQGMLCSAKELGIDADASGLLELPADAPVGSPMAAYLGLPDASFELKLTPNRADCFSVRGVAFDVAAALSAQVNALEIPEAAITSQASLAVDLHAGADCPRYCGRVIEGVDAAARSPLWLTERLKRAGLRPISPLVDITNYVMLELGQPMHAFDADTLHGPVGVRRGRKGETLKLLDERDVALDDGFLLITDGDRPVALAGVMGGWETRVTDATTRVFMESAHFAPSVIIGRARRIGLHTDASHRFERGVDPQLPRYALERATALVLQVMGGRAGAITEAALPEHLPQPQPVALRRARLARVLGITVADAEVERILRALGMQVAATAEGWSVLPPTRRFDIAIEEDLIEEVARIHGYDAIPTTTPSGQIRLAAPVEGRVADAVLRRQLTGRGYLEAINYAFVDGGTLATWQLQAGAVALANPLSGELGVMRTSLLPGLVDALARNRARQQPRVRLFELGRVFQLTEGAPLETPRIAAVACGRQASEQWNADDREVDFFDLKADVEALLALANATAEFRPDASPFGHPGRSASVWRDGQRIGWVGHLHPGLAKALDLDGEVVGFELDLAPLAERAVPRASELSRYPSVRRDIALVVPESTPWAALRASLEAALGPLLREVRLFDRYVGPGLDTGSKSL
ncbi:MAG: phenylalanine--tRNA ligase subunit beta, partial [Arenimonas sp.]|uniref:phenylalanine--tRNA ligase subunit beta n=1 Tax=Arenimonas sp. TaxID=1872635 RepID=UPI0025C52F6D